MNFLILHQAEYSAGCITDPERVNELLTEYPVHEGAVVRGGVVDQALGLVRITSCSNERVTFEFIPQEPAPRRSHVAIALAVPRPQAIRKVLLFAAMAGVVDLHFIRTARTDPSYIQSKMLRPEEYLKELFKGLCQAGDTVSPQLFTHRSIKEFVRHERVVALRENRFVCSTAQDCNTRFENYLFSKHLELRSGVALVVIGPELGFEESELSQLKDEHFTAISLGPRILRVESAVTTAFSELEMALRIASHKA